MSGEYKRYRPIAFLLLIILKDRITLLNDLSIRSYISFRYDAAHEQLFFIEELFSLYALNLTTLNWTEVRHIANATELGQSRFASLGLSEATRTAFIGSSIDISLLGASGYENEGYIFQQSYDNANLVEFAVSGPNAGLAVDDRSGFVFASDIYKTGSLLIGVFFSPSVS